MNPLDIQLERELDRAGYHRQMVEAQRSEASADLWALVREAADRGWTKVRIAKVAGISRQTVHEILKD